MQQLLQNLTKSINSILIPLRLRGVFYFGRGFSDFRASDIRDNRASDIFVWLPVPSWLLKSSWVIVQERRGNEEKTNLPSMDAN